MKTIIERMRSVRWMLVFYDVIVFLLTVGIFFWYYHGGNMLNTTEERLAESTLAFLCIFGFRLAGNIYRQIWRYGGVQCYIRLILVDMCGTACYMILNLILPVPTISMSRIISVACLNCCGALFMRMCYRYAFKCGNEFTAKGRFLNSLLAFFAGREIVNQRQNMLQQKKVAIIGAGRTGVSLAEDLLNNSQSLYQPVCFIDNSDAKIGRSIHDIPVLAEKVINFSTVQDYEIDEFVMAVPEMESEDRRTMYEFYSQFRCPIKIYDFPTMRTAGARRQLRSFEVEEVLFRPPLVVTDEKCMDYYGGKVILVTGGGGSIGSELARQVVKMKPKQLILLDIYENGVYDVQQDMRMAYGKELDVQIAIMSIANYAGMARVFEKYHPQIVIHAAAHKHVPLMENNCIEAIENNVFGTENVLRLCEEYGAERFMMLSTDKAVNPTNVMGATKRMCEMIMEAHSTRGMVKCSATRFGNVLGSAGSVIPLFKRQIAAGGPVTLTDRRIIRYFMTIPEASQLVLQSGAMAKNGELFVLDMGEPVKILKLAESMITLSGLRPYKDIDIVETGLRPGEKLYEELLVSSEELDRTDNRMIFIERDKPISMDQLQEKLAVLKEACASGVDEEAREALRRVVPTFHRPEEVNGRV